MKNPERINLLTSQEIRSAGWQAETRDADGHVCRTHKPFETDEEIVWLVREGIQYGETITIWPNFGPSFTPAPATQTVGEDWRQNCQYLLDLMDNEGFDFSNLCEDDQAGLNDIRALLDEEETTAQSNLSSEIEAKIGDFRLEFEGDLDKWMKIIGAGITGYQPEAYALMDLACDELVKLRAMLSYLNQNTALEIVWQEVNGDPSECGWHVFRRFGGRSDRDFKVVGTGETVEEAINHAMEGQP